METKRLVRTLWAAGVLAMGALTASEARAGEGCPTPGLDANECEQYCDSYCRDYSTNPEEVSGCEEACSSGCEDCS
jgi:hypothetical protein